MTTTTHTPDDDRQREIERMMREMNTQLASTRHRLHAVGLCPLRYVRPSPHR